MEIAIAVFSTLFFSPLLGLVLCGLAGEKKRRGEAIIGMQLIFGLAGLVVCVFSGGIKYFLG